MQHNFAHSFNCDYDCTIINVNQRNIISDPSLKIIKIGTKLRFIHFYTELKLLTFLYFNVLFKKKSSPLEAIERNEKELHEIVTSHLGFSICTCATFLCQICAWKAEEEMRSNSCPVWFLYKFTPLQKNGFFRRYFDRCSRFEMNKEDYFCNFYQIFCVKKILSL